MSKISYNYGTQPELLELEGRNSDYVRMTNDKVLNGLEIFTPFLMTHRLHFN